MTRTAALPFDFDEFGVDKTAPEPVFTAEQLENARREAHAAALQSLIAEQARAQTELLEEIVVQLAAAQNGFDSALGERREDLVATAREIVTTFCSAAAADRQPESILGLLDKYLAATPDQSPVALLLPATATDASVTAVKKAIDGRKITDFVSVAKSAALPSTDCRIEWRGGAIMRDMNVIAEEIRTIFTSDDCEIIAAGDQKARKS